MPVQAALRRKPAPLASRVGVLIALPTSLANRSACDLRLLRFQLAFTLKSRAIAPVAPLSALQDEMASLAKLDVALVHAHRQKPAGPHHRTQHQTQQQELEVGMAESRGSPCHQQAQDYPQTSEVQNESQEFRHKHLNCSSVGCEFIPSR